MRWLFGLLGSVSLSNRIIILDETKEPHCVSLKMWDRMWSRFPRDANLSFSIMSINALNGSGGGTRTPDTRIMIPLL